VVWECSLMGRGTVGLDGKERWEEVEGRRGVEVRIRSGGDAMAVGMTNWVWVGLGEQGRRHHTVKS